MREERAVNRAPRVLPTKSLENQADMHKTVKAKVEFAKDVRRLTVWARERVRDRNEKYQGDRQVNERNYVVAIQKTGGGMARNADGEKSRKSRKQATAWARAANKRL